nr:MAG TPA: Protein of unknown function (DUF3894) [Caudoviricetes sp.]
MCRSQQQYNSYVCILLFLSFTISILSIVLGIISNITRLCY